MPTSKVHPSGHIAYYGTHDSKTTTGNDYVDVGELKVWFTKTLHYMFTATIKDLKVRILGSIDGGVTYDIVAEAEFVVTTAAAVHKTITTFYTNLKVQVKPSADNQHGTLATKFAGADL